MSRSQGQVPASSRVESVGSMRSSVQAWSRRGPTPRPSDQTEQLPFNELLVESVEQSHSTGIGAFDYYPRLERVHRWVLENLDQRISVSNGAAVACLETKYFSRFFRQRVGVTFTTFVNACRVARAIRMVSVRDRSMQEVIIACGFRNYRSCERWFKRLLGISPRNLKNFIVRKGIAVAPDEDCRILEDKRRIDDTDLPCSALGTCHILGVGFQRVQDRLLGTAT